MKVLTQIPNAEIDPSAILGMGTKIWQGSQVRERVEIGTNCILGRMVYVGPDVKIGNNVKIQNFALIYDPCELGDGVFIGPNVVITNDKYPRAINSDGSLKSLHDWKPVGVRIREGASIGAGAICVAPLEIGKWAVVAAGSVVTKDVADYALVMGTPARRVGWVGRTGVPLIAESSGRFVCPISGDKYVQISETELLEVVNK